MTDYTKEAKALLDELFGPSWRVNPKHEDGHAVEVVDAALRRAGRGGRGMSDCRHRKAWPTIYYQAAGFLWCPDCGARREIRVGTGNSFYASEPYWVRPGEGWARDMRKNEKRKAKEDEE